MVVKRTQIKILLFIINPFLGFFYSLRDIKTISSYRIIYLFFLLFGLCLTVTSQQWIEEDSYYLDGMFHRYDFEQIKNETSQEFKEKIISISKGESKNKDYFDVTIKYVISRITDNYHILFFTIAVFFCFFSMKSLKILLQSPNFKNNSLIFIILFYLFLTIQIFEINGVRFFTAAWMAVFCIFKILIEKKETYWILLLSTPLVHISFIFFIGVVCMFILLKRKLNLLSKLFFISFFLAEITKSFLESNFNILPPFLYSWASFYINKDMAFGSGGRFYDIFDFLTRFYGFLLITLLIKNLKQITLSNPKSIKLFAFLLTLTITSNITLSIPDLGARFNKLTYPFIVYLWVDNYNIMRKYDYIILCMPLFYFYKIFYYDPILYSKVLEPCFFYSSPIYLTIKYLFNL